jgi:aspartyl-tRNA(Asn)/glutamyl-tRNA(Gln) amidotransferase subunit C
MGSTTSIDRAEVHRIALLARLTLDDEERDSLTSDLRGILDYMTKLEELDTSDVVPTSHAIDLPTALREDEVRDGLPVNKGLRGAPERLADAFGVPRVIE